jgi:spore maturation protein CgeB
LFEPDVEAVYFKSLDALPGLIDRYANAPKERQKIAEAARKRFLAEHTAHHRMVELSIQLNEIL